jgi:hypothetical protein
MAQHRCLRTLEASRPTGASSEHDTRQLHAMAPGLVGQTIERARGYKQDATVPCRRQDSGGCMWIAVWVALPAACCGWVVLRFARCGRPTVRERVVG